MSKTIIIDDVNIQEISFRKNDSGVYNVNIIYSLVDGDGNKYNTRNSILGDFTANQITRIDEIFDFIKNKILTAEGINN